MIIKTVDVNGYYIKIHFRENEIRVSRSDSGEFDDSPESRTAPVLTVGRAGEIGPRLLGS